MSATTTTENATTQTAATVLGQIATAASPTLQQPAALNLAAVTAKIQAEYTLLTAALNSGLERAKNIGRLLSEVRGRTTDQEWRAFMDDLPFGPSSAANYIRVFRQWDKLPHDALNYSDAIKALAKKDRTPAKKEAEGATTEKSPFVKLVEDRMKEFKVRGTVANVVKFLEAFGVQQAAE